MEWIIGISGIIVGIIGIITPYLRSKYILRPELTIEIVPVGGGGSLPIGLSANNDFSKGYVDADTANRIFKLEWRFNIIITNNSELIAFYPKIEFNPNGPQFSKIDRINELEPIQPAASLVLKGIYNRFEEKTGKNRTKIGHSLPPEFLNLEILLGYENSKKRRFFTLYKNNLAAKNIFLRKRPESYGRV